MTQTTWNDLGPREKQLLGILRRADEPLASRDVLGTLQEEGEDVAYTTVSTILDRLVEKGLITREEERNDGSMRFRYSFDPAEHRVELVESLVQEVESVFDGPGLELLVRKAQHTDSGSATDREDKTDRRSGAQ